MAHRHMMLLCGCMVLLLAAQGSFALKCYDDCHKSIDCTGNCYIYSKDETIKRGCADFAVLSGRKVDGCLEVDGEDEAACICSTELCNASSRMIYSITAIMSLALVAAVITRM